VPGCFSQQDEKFAGTSPLARPAVELQTVPTAFFIAPACGQPFFCPSQDPKPRLFTISKKTSVICPPKARPRQGRVLFPRLHLALSASPGKLADTCFAWLQNEGLRPSRTRQWPFEEVYFGKKTLPQNAKPSKIRVNPC